MTQNRKKVYEIFIKQWLKENANFDANKIALENFSEYDKNFEVIVKNLLEVGCNIYTKSGRAGEFDNVYTRELEFEDMISKMVYEAKQNNKIAFDMLYSKIENGSYGLFKEKTTIKPSTIIPSYEYDCKECRGKGGERCTHCGGNGGYRCTKCIDGLVRCSSCKGRGYRQNGRECYSCNGSGKVKCSQCNNGWVKCSSCDKGWVKCSKCNGETCFTDTAYVGNITNPSYEFGESSLDDLNKHEKIKRALDDIGIQNLADVANKINREQIERKINEIYEIYAINVTFTEFITKIDGKKYNWFFCGYDAMRICENDNIIANLLDRYIKTLEKLSKSPWTIRPLIQNNAVKYLFRLPIIKESIAKSFVSRFNAIKIDINKEIESKNILDEKLLDKICNLFYNVIKNFVVRVDLFCILLKIIAFIAVVVEFDFVWWSFLSFIVLFPLINKIASTYKQFLLERHFGQDICKWYEVCQKKLKKPNNTAESIAEYSSFLSFILSIVILIAGYFFLDDIFAKANQIQQSEPIQISKQIQPNAQKQTQKIKQKSMSNNENLANLPIIKLATKDDYVNLRKAPSGDIITQIYKKDFNKIAIKKLGSEGKWLKVLYFPPNVSDKNEAIVGYIHASQVKK